MNNALSSVAILTMASIVGSAAIAAETTQVRITGKITPTACSVVVGNSGTFDYGIIKTDQLSESQPLVLTPKKNSLAIDCQAGAIVALSAHDERGGTVMDGVENIRIIGNSGGYQKDQWLGLGQTTEKKNIGAYLLVVGDVSDTLDGARGFAIGSNDSGKTWISTASLANLTSSPTRYVGWGKTTVGPAASAKQFRSILTVYPALNTSKELDIKQETNLDGLATLTLHYL